MLNCAILDDYQNCALSFADWNSLPEVKVKNFTQYIGTSDALIEQLSPFEVIVAMRERTKFDAALLGHLPRLKLLVTTGMKNASIDVDAAIGRGITVCGTRGSPSPTPELAWGLLLALARSIPAEVESVRAGGWQTRVGVGLSGKTLGIVGLGTIGKRMARFAHAFDMSVIAWSPRIKDEACKAAGAQRASSLDDLMEHSDFVTVHMVLADSTRGMIGARELSKMKSSAMLMNTSRGPLINEDALIEALKMNRIAGAALDVYDTEPLPPTHPLRTLPNVVCTPHIGYVSKESYRLFYGDAVEDIQAWLNGSPVRVLPALA